MQGACGERRDDAYACRLAWAMRPRSDVRPFGVLSRQRPAKSRRKGCWHPAAGTPLLRSCVRR